MTTEAEFEALNAEIRETRPMFDDFCARHGFEYVNPLALGRYPRIRIRRERIGTEGMVNIWFELWMELDEKGRRFEKFAPNLPYELSAGAYVDIQEDSKYVSRYSVVEALLSGKKMTEIAPLLLAEMERYLPSLEQLTAEAIRANGRRIILGGASP